MTEPTCAHCHRGLKDNREVLIFRKSEHWHPACYNAVNDLPAKALAASERLDCEG